MRREFNRLTRTAGLAAALPLVLAALFAVSIAVPAQADVLVSNVGKADGNTGALSSYDQAQGFTTGSSELGYTVTSVDIDFEDAVSTASYVVTIAESDSKDRPGTSLGTLTGPASLTANALNTFEASGSGITLAKDTKYFVVVDSSSFFSSSLQNTADNGEDDTGADDWTIADVSLFRNQSSTSSSDYTEWSQSKKIRINGTPIASSDATLSGLVLQNASDDSAVSLSPTFGAATKSYDASVAIGVQQITIKPTANDSGATVAYLDRNDMELEDANTGKDDHQVRLGHGTNTIKVKVTAEDGTTTDTYTVDVVRASPAQCGSDDVWCATMTVGVLQTGGFPFGYGYNVDTGIGSLSDDEFDYGGTDYVVSVIWTPTGSDPTLSLSLDPTGESVFDTDKFTLIVGGTVFAFDGATFNTGSSQFQWSNSGLSWSNGDSVTVRLRSANTPATGQPEISGTPQVGQALTAEIGTIADTDGLTNSTFPDDYTFQWIRVDGTNETDISGATSHTYTLQTADEGKTVRVKLSFTDDGAGAETRTSEPFPSTGTVLASAGSCIADHDWCTTMTVGKRVAGPITLWGFTSTYGSLDDPVTFGGGTYTVTSLLLQTESGVAVTVSLTAGAFLPRGSVFDFGGTEFTADAGGETTTTPGGYQWTPPGAFAWTEGQKVTVSVKFPGTAATGKPAVSGTPQVGETLTAGQGTIDDADGLPSGTFPAGYSFQWVRVDADGTSNPADISGATSRTYTLEAADLGKRVRVKVSFTDGGGNPETLTSDAFPAGGTVLGPAGTCVTNHNWCTTMTIGEWELFGSDFHGYDADRSGAGTVDDPTFTYGDTTYELKQLRTESIHDFGGSLALRYANVQLSEDPPLGTIFGFGTHTFTTTTASGAAEGVGNNSWDAIAGPEWADGQQVKVSANLAPGLQSATVDGDELVLTYGEDLDETSAPAVTAYAVKVDGGAGAAPSGVAVAGKTVTLILAPAVTSGQTVTVSYTAPSSNPVQDESGLGAPAFTDRAVTNNTGVTNTPATGAPTITGTPQVGQELTADTSGIMDADGVPSTFTYEWVRVDGSSNETGIGTNAATYTLVAADEDHTIKVKVSFTDVGGNAEGPLESAETATVTAAADNCPSPNVRLISGGDASKGSVQICHEDEWRHVCDDHWEKVDADVVCRQLGYPGAQRATILSEFVSLISVEFWLDDVDCTGDEASLGECGHRGWGVHNCRFSERAGAVCRGNVNTPATGAPTISGTAVVGETVTASTAGIADGDGKTKAENGDTGYAYTYQWYQVDADGVSNKAAISGATSSSYTLTNTEAGKRVIVEVSFTDDGDHDEGPLASDAYPGTGTVEAADTAAPTVSAATVDGTALVITFNETLAAAANLVNDPFEVKKTPSGGAEETVALSGTPALSGMTVTLTLAAAVTAGDVVTVSYAKPTSGTDNTLKDAADNEVASFTDQAVTNDTVVVNSPATGAAIDGPAQVGMTLTADTGGIEDADGLAGAVFDYQWIRIVGGSDVEIGGATGATYTVVPADQGRRLKVRVAFKDDAGNDEAPESPSKQLAVPAAVDHCDHLTVWCATLTAGQKVDDSDPEDITVAQAGYDADEGIGSLDVATFVHRSVTYTVTQFVSGANQDLFFATTPTLPADGAGLTVHVQRVSGEVSLPLGDIVFDEQDQNWFFASALWASESEGHTFDDNPLLHAPYRRETLVQEPTEVGTEIGVRLSRSISAGAALSALSLEDRHGNEVALSPAFATETTGYTAGVGNAVDEITVDATPDDSNASVEYLDGGDTVIEDADTDREGLQVPLAVDRNTIQVKVTAEDELTVETYTVTVTRAPCDGLWCATLIVQDLGGGDRGCAGAPPGTACSSPSILSEDAFRHVSTDYAVTAVRVQSDGQLQLWLSPDLATDTEDLVLHAGSASFAFAEADDTNANNLRWDASGLGWSAGDRVYLRLTEYGAGTEGELRLVGGPTDDEGRLEVFHDGQWGTVCDDRLYRSDNIAPQFACELMGFETGAMVAREAITDMGLAPETRPIWLDDVLCLEDSKHWTGEDPTKLHHCFHAGWGLNNCTREEDLHLSCGDEQEVLGQTESGPLTAEFRDLPPGHDGQTPFTLRIAFSEAVATSYVTMRDHAVTVGGGAVTGARRVDGSSALWELTVAPSGPGEVTLQVPPDRACTEEGALCTADGRALSAGLATLVLGPPPGGVPLSASFLEVPGEHDGSTPFELRLEFSEEVAIGYATLRDHAFEVTGGTVTGARRTEPGSNAGWWVTVEPDTNQAVTVTLPVRGCAETGAVCTSGGEALAGPVTASVAGPAALPPLTASFEEVPAEHDGETPFKLAVSFSAPVGISWVTLRDEAVTATGGAVTGARRVGSSALWELTVEPSGTGAVTLTLAAPAACGEPGAVCTSDGRALANAPSVTVAGPPGLSVADAEVEEAAGAALAFAVTLSRPSSGTVTVAYATSDGTATAGADYTAASDTLTFAVGEKAAHSTNMLI